MTDAVLPLAPLSEFDRHLFREGTHFSLASVLGAHPGALDGERGTAFRVWAPNAARVSLLGDFNGWHPDAHPLHPAGDGTGLFSGFVPGLGPGERYKYRVASRHAGFVSDRADPVAFAAEHPPGTASRVADLSYTWSDGSWLAERGSRQSREAPVSCYEVHAGSWRRDPSEPGRPLSWGELADPLVDHVADLGFTHVELMPVMEHPFYPSWGYQCLGYFAPTARHGAPQDLMRFIDRLHQAGIGVILDWVPSHFPTDGHGLAFFDGTHLYEHAHPLQRLHPEWGSAVFNLGRNEVRAFLGSSARFWVERYHADGLRVDAVASMLYLDYGRRPGEWVPNVHGGRESLEAVSFLRELNHAVLAAHPGTLMCAEESTAWPLVTRPPYTGGLGFSLKWNMGWMHDSLAYFARDPVFRRYHHGEMTFSTAYAWSEDYVLPLSHDEVVHMKGSLLDRMPGDDWQRRANLRLLLGHLFTHPGKKLLFMGGEFGQEAEWNFDASLDWHLLADERHAGILRFTRDAARLYRDLPALHERDHDPGGFAWVVGGDADQSVFVHLRRGAAPGAAALVVLNATPVTRHPYRVGVPCPGRWREVLNSDAAEYGGSGAGNLGGVPPEPVPSHGYPQSLVLVLPPLACLVLVPEGA